MLLLGFAVTGCGGQSTGDITGKVTYDGKPLPAGRVMFFWRGGENAYSSVIKEDGSYSLFKVPVGPVQVTVETFPPVPVGILGGMGGAKPDAAPTMPPGSARYVKIPAKYRDKIKSLLTYEVKKGAQTYDIDLKPE
jgi:hypothetical protein